MHTNSLPDLGAVSRTRHNRQPRVTWEAIVGLRQTAERELAAAVARDDDGVRAGGAQSARRGLPWLLRIVHDDLMFTSETVTRGVRVSVLSEYSSDRSRPSEEQWFFLYTITITNESQQTVQLVSRHWIITHGNGRVEEIKGPGVVGQQPVLAPGQTFTYTSGCPLPTPFGTMKGTYQMTTQGGDDFEVEIAPFTLSEPYTVH